MYELILTKRDRAIAQVISRWLPTAAARVMSGHVGFVVDKIALGQVFSKYLGFPYRSFHRLLHAYHHPSSGTDTVEELMADVPSGLSLIPLQEIN
jgi:hypothetical protein